MSDQDVDRLVRGYVSGQLSRRQFIRRGLGFGLSLGALGAILQACGGQQPTAASQQPAPSAQPTAPKPKELVVLGWGAAYGDSLKKYVSDPFEAETGIKVLFQTQPDAASSLAKLQAEQASPTVDVWLASGALPLLLARRGGLTELSAAKVPNITTIIPQALQNFEGKTYGAGIHLGVRTITVDNTRIRSFIPDYNPSMLKSWTFLYRPELKNQISITGFSGSYGSAMISMGYPYGGTEKDIEKFFAAMKKLAPNVHHATEGAGGGGIGQLTQFKNKEVVAAQNNMVDAQQIVKNGVSVDIGYPTDPLSMNLDRVVAIKNGPAGGDWALSYINRLLDPKQFGEYAGLVGSFAPSTKAVQPTLASLPPIAVDEIIKNGWQIDYDIVIDKFAEWLVRYNKEIVPLYGK
jgi:spermidine/putrescine-binding protein